MWYYLKCELIFFLFIGFLGFPINRMLCHLFSIQDSTIQKYLNTKEKS
jgi:hypothetical protein